MKKLLALVLALVMTLGLATVGANAALKDFSDADQVSNEEAMAVMNAVGVFIGDSGKINPKGNLTRAEAAKLVAYLDLGEKAAEALPAVAAFADVPASHWASKYIAYCKDAGIMQGYNNQFDPNGSLTGYAFGAFVLAVLGYDRNIEGMTGDNWMINAAKLMSKNDITKGAEKAGSETLTREEAAQYCLNALKADTVEYDTKGTNITIGGAANVTVGASKAEAVEDGTIIKAHQAVKDEKANGASKTNVQLGEKLYDGDLKLKEDTDEFNRPASVWTYKNGEVGKYSDTPDETLKNTFTRGDLYAALGSTVVDELKKSGTKSTITLYIDGELVAKDAYSVGTDTELGTISVSNIVKNNKNDFEYLPAGKDAKETAPAGNGSTTYIYVGENDGVYTVNVNVINTYVAQVSSVNAASGGKDRSITLKSKDKANTPEDYETESYAKDDVVEYTASKASGSWEIQSIQKVTDTKTVTLSSVSSNAKSFTADGTSYKMNLAAIKKDIDSDSAGDSFTLYMGSNGFVLWAEPYNDAVDFSKYLVLTAIDKDGTKLNNTVKANAITLDGIKLDEISIDKLDNTSITTGKLNGLTTKTVYSFTKDAGGKYVLKYVAAPYETSALSINKDQAKSGYAFYAKSTAVGKNASGSAITANNSTKFIVYNADKNNVKVYDGIGKMVGVTNDNASWGAYISKKDGTTAKAVFVWAGATEGATSSANEIVYILSTTATVTKDGDDTVWTYSVIKNGEKTTISTEDYAPGDLSKGVYFIDEYDGQYVSAMYYYNNSKATNDGDYKYAVIDNSDKSADYDEGVFSIAGNSYVCNNDTKVWKIDSGDGVSKMSLDGLASTNTKLTYWVVLATDKKEADTVKYIFVKEAK